MKTLTTLTISALALAFTSTALAQGSAKTSDRASAATAAKKDAKKIFGFVPIFMEVAPDHALPGAWETMKAVQLNPNTALSPKDKELIGLAVASQIPCEYCTFAHTEFAGLNGATSEELREAVGMAAMTRLWSTYLNGARIDRAQFERDIARLVAGAKKGGPKAEPVNVVDTQSARLDIQNTFGFVPGFLSALPDVALPGMWIELRDQQLNPNTNLSPKVKELVGLAVASQIPCQYCTIAHTEFAKLNGASETEVKEAIMIASIVRHWSTIVNGNQVDKKRFKREIRRIVANIRKKHRS